MEKKGKEENKPRILVFNAENLDLHMHIFPRFLGGLASN